MSNLDFSQAIEGRVRSLLGGKTVEERLAERLGLPATKPKPAAKPDFSAFAVPPQPASKPDFSQFAAPERSFGEAAKSAGGSFAQGATAAIAGIPKSLAIAEGQRRTNVLRALDEFDAGRTLTPQEIAAAEATPGGIFEPVYRYGTATPEERVKMRAGFAEWLGSSDPREMSFYKAGKALEEAVAGVVPVDPEYAEGFITGKVPQGLGSAAGFLMTGITGRLIGLPVLATAGGAGAGLEATSQFEDALANAASIEDAFRASNWGALAGTSEALPIIHLLDRIDKGTGGSIKKFLLDAMKQGTEEALQEAFQTVVGNLIANRIVAYDPERGTFEGTGEATGVGFTVGGLMQTLGSLVFSGRKGRARIEQEAGEEPDAQAALEAPAIRMPDRNQQIAETLRGTREPVVAPTPGAPDFSAQAVPAPADVVPEATPEELAILRGARWSDDDIAAMEPEERAEAVVEARGQGVKPDFSAEAVSAPEVVVPPLSPEETVKLRGPPAEAVQPAPVVPEPAQPEAPPVAAEAAPVAPEMATPKAPAVVEKPEDLAAAGARVETEPTDAQVEAGNYRKAHVKVQGLEVTVENPKGSVRRSKPGVEPPWEVTIPAAYGYVKRTEGADGDQVDVYVGDNPDAPSVFVVDQNDLATGRFDEHKAMLGFPDQAAATAAYEAAFSDGRGADRVGGVTEMSVDEFKAWLREGDTSRALSAPVSARTAPKPARKRQTSTAPRPVNLYAVILAMGGMKDVRGEVARGLGLPGHVRVRFMRKGGRDPDKIREGLAEQGYFNDLYGTPERAVAESTPSDLYDLIDRFSRGEKIYAPEDRGEALRLNEETAHRAEARRVIDEALVGEDAELAERATAIVLETGVDPVDAIERAAFELVDEAVPAQNKARTNTDAAIPFFDDIPAKKPQRVAAGGQQPRASGEGVGERSRSRAEAEDGGAALSDGRKTEGAESPKRVGSVSEEPAPALARPDDLPYEEALAAYRWNSMTPERRARQDQADYVAHIQSVFDELSARASTPDQRALLREEVERYRQGYLSRLRSVLATRSRTASSMVTGPARFPTERNRKALDAERNKVEDLYEWRDRAKAAIARRLDAARTPDQVSEADWADLRKRLDHDIATIVAIDTGKMPGFDRGAFTSSISNRLKRLADKGESALVQRALDHIRAAQEGQPKPIITDRSPVWGLGAKAADVAAEPKAAGIAEHAAFDGGRIVVNHDLDRIQIVFDAKPGEEVRAKLRGAGWRWSPTEGAWQRQNTNAALYSAEQITGAKAAPQPTAETVDTLDGPREQFVLPGAERVTDAELARRKASDRLKPKAAQKPMDEGLFGEAALQPDMFGGPPRRLGSTTEHGAAPAFYSAALRAVENAKITKGTPGQWLATLRNTPGVKQEELDWIGLPDWLQAQSGAVTRDAVAEFVRANQIEVRDVVKGGDDLLQLNNQWEEAASAVNAGIRDDLPESTMRALRDKRDALRDRIERAGDDEEQTQHATYQLPGGENYRELLLTLPSRDARPDQITTNDLELITVSGGTYLFKTPDGEHVSATANSEADARFRAVHRWSVKHSDDGDFRTSHFPEPNILAHIRFNERTDAEGKRTLFIEEVQSDWHQAGRKKGYAVAGDIAGYTAQQDSGGFWEVLNSAGEMVAHVEAANEVAAIALAAGPTAGRIPDAPFKTTWPELALKRMIRWSAENGFDQVAWTPGIEQVKRYETSLRQQVRRIEWGEATLPGRRMVNVYGARDALDFEINDRGVVTAAFGPNTTPAVGQPIEDVVGKDIARNILEQPKGKIERDNLTIGGKGMTEFYDRILVNAANKLGKKFGAKVGEARIENENDVLRNVTVIGRSGEPIHLADSRQQAEAWLRANGHLNFAEGATIDAMPAGGTSVHSLPITTAMRDSAMQGQPLFRDQPDGTPAPRVKVSPAKRRTIERKASEIVSRIAGRKVNVRFADQIRTRDVLSPALVRQLESAAESRGNVLSETTLGLYDMSAEPLITIAMADPVRGSSEALNTAGHEAWHHVEFGLLSPAERSILKREMPRIMEYAALERGDVSGLPAFEVTAIAFERYRRAMEEGRASVAGLHIAVRRIFEKIRQMLRQLQRALNREGITRFEDLFEESRTGRVARRAELREDMASGLETALAAPPSILASVGEVTPPLDRAPPSSAAPYRHFQARSIAKSLSRASDLSDAIRVKIQDKALPIRRLQEQIEAETGTTIPIDLDVYVAEAIYHGRAGERLEDIRTKVVEPLVAQLRRAVITVQELGDYLYARHASERNEAIKRIDPKNTAGSGMTDELAGRILARVRKSGKQADYEAAAKIIDRMQEETRKTLLKAGLIDRATFDSWSQMYAHYVPLRGFEVGAEESERVRAGRGFDVRGPEARRALGRRSKADNPVLYAILQAEQAILRSEKNRVGKTLLRLVNAFPNDAMWKVHKGEMRRRVNPTTGLIETTFVQPQFLRDDNLFSVKVGGKTTFVEIKHRALAKSLRGVGTDKQNIVVNAMMRGARIFAALQTQWNPEFVISNAARDLQTALVNVSDVKEKPEAIRRKIVADAVSLKAIRGILSALQGKGESEYAPWFDEYRRAGGKISFIELNDIDRIRRRIETSLRSGRVRMALRNGMKLIEDINSSVENGVRLSTYIALRRAGVAKDRAAFVARELTVNFNRKGEWGPALNSMWVFFNASIQGSVRIAHALTRSKTARYAVGSIFGFGVAMEIMNALIAGDDDDGENAYDKIPEWERERNLIIMIPGHPENGYIKIPMPYGYNVPYLAGQQMMAVIRRKRKPLEAAGAVAAATMDSFNPIGTAASFLQFLSPTLLDPVVQLAENKTWFGGKIKPTRFDPRKPESEMYFASAPWWAVGIAKTLNEKTGGNVGRSGLIDVSPEDIEHYADFVTGGAGRFVFNGLETGKRLVTGEDWLPEKMPFVRRVFGKETIESDRRAFYDAWDEVDGARYEVRQLAKAGQRTEARAAQQEHTVELRFYDRFKSAFDTVSDLRDAVDRIETNTSLSRDEKIARRDAIQKRERALIDRLLAAYGRAKQ